jgi:hypothetical protein
MKVSWTIKNITVLSLMVATIICLLSGCSKAQQISANNKPLPSERKILIVYLSRTNNTKAIAEFIHQKVGGTMVPLELQTPYPANYNATVQQLSAAFENKDRPHRAVRFCVPGLPDLGDAAAAAC